jgi:exodeoxyribonuclease VII large subunit
MSPPTPADRDIYTPSRLNLEARSLLEGHFPLLWIEGELSNLARPASGHLYFSLKDARAQVRCAMFRNRNRALRFRPADGQQVLLRARAGLYEGRGEFQLIVESMEEAGHGALQRAYDELHARLAAEGLFDDDIKHALPTLPRRIGVITSPSGAALRDVLHVLARRFPAAEVILYPATVQGDEAPGALRAALATAVRRNECNVLLLARGGGSLEDLWAFNDEGLAREIRACPIPVVTGVGHETDFTIADFVADLRAPTPSAAAEAASPDGAAWRRRFNEVADRLDELQRGGLTRRQERLDWLQRRLQVQHPAQRLREKMQRLDGLEQRLQRGWNGADLIARHRLDVASSSLAQHAPTARVRTFQETVAALDHRLRLAARQCLERGRQKLVTSSRALDMISPLATLGRGYAIVSDDDGHILRRADATRVGAKVNARLAEGQLECRVESIRAKGES